MREAEFRVDINGLRGLSVALVVGYHLQGRGLAGGFVGVDAFFVVSGYLMTRIVWGGLETGGFRYSRFIAARAARIVPALAVLVALLLSSGALWLPPFDLVRLAEQALWSLGFASNHYFLAHGGYNTVSIDTHWLLHSWSLSIEAQFYLLYPLLLIAACRLGGGHPRRVAVALVAATAAASLLFQLASSDPRPMGAFFLLPARAWEMLVGGLVWFLPAPDPHRERWRWPVGLAGLALLLGSMLYIGMERRAAAGLGALTLAPVAGVAALLWAHDADSPLRFPPLQVLGRWSYSIYLWHWPLVIAWRIAAGSGLKPGWIAATALVSGSLLCGALSYRFVERMRGGSAERARPLLLRRAAFAAGFASVVSICTLQTDGLDVGVRKARHDSRLHHAASEASYFPAQCSNFLKPAAEVAICPIDRGGAAPRVLVIGDSHAEHLYAWFDRHSEVDVDFFTEAECPPVPRFERLQPGYDCSGYAERAWQLARSPRYGTVVVAARWQTVGLRGPPYCRYGEVPESPCIAPSASDKPEQVVAALRAALVATLAAGKTVIVVDSAPESAIRVPERLAREIFWFGEPRLELDRRALLAQTDWVDRLFRELVLGHPGFHLVSLRGQLCTQDRCRVVDAETGRPIYIDESHFDPQWIAAHGDALAPFTRRRPGD